MQDSRPWDTRTDFRSSASHQVTSHYLHFDLLYTFSSFEGSEMWVKKSDCAIECEKQNLLLILWEIWRLSVMEAGQFIWQPQPQKVECQLRMTGFWSTAENSCYHPKHRFLPPFLHCLRNQEGQSYTLSEYYLYHLPLVFICFLTTTVWGFIFMFYIPSVLKLIRCVSFSYLVVISQV